MLAVLPQLEISRSFLFWIWWRELAVLTALLLAMIVVVAAYVARNMRLARAASLDPQAVNINERLKQLSER
jgi:hypothetical protein